MGLWLCLSALVPGVCLSAVSPQLKPFGPYLCRPVVVIKHGGGGEPSPQSLHCGLCSKTGSGQAVPGPWSPAGWRQRRQARCQRRRGAAEGPRTESQPHPDKQMGMKGARLFARTQSLLDKEKASRLSHLNDVDRWRPIVVVVVLGELQQERGR